MRMKKFFTLIAMAVMALCVQAQNATDAYLDIANYATLDNIDLKNCTKLYSYDATKKVLVLSGYAAYQSAQQNQEAGKTGLGFVTYTSSGSSGVTGGWSATGDFKGSSFYGLQASSDPQERAAGVNSSRAYTFKIKGIAKVSVLGKSGGTSRHIVMTVKEGETEIATKQDNSNTIVTLSVEDLDVNKTYTVTVTGDDSSNGHFYEIAFYQSVTASNPTAATTWNFTTELSSSDAANLSADATNWEFDSENGFWKNKSKLTDRNVYTAIKANGVELDITKGLTFTRDNSSGLEAGRIRIAPGKNFAINGSAVLINFGDLVKNDVLRLRIKGAGDSERSLTITNTEVTSGSLTTTDINEHDVVLKVLADGGVTIKTGNGFQFLAITINAALPNTTGINTIEAELNSNAPAYNIAGQKVADGFKGVVIKNGKKLIQK